MRTHRIIGLHNKQTLNPTFKSVVPNSQDVLGPYSLLTPLQQTKTLLQGGGPSRSYGRGWRL
jgi:hypothetical protein